MVMRFFLITGLILLGGTAYFVVGQQPPTYQAAPMIGEVTILQQEGVLPTGDLAEDEEVEHSIFGVPEEDEVQLAAAMANMDMDMDMDMSDGGDMDMGTDGDMNMETDGNMDMGTDGDMNMETDGNMDMAEEEDPDHAAEAEAEADPHGEADAEEEERLMAGRMAGLIIQDDGAYDREITLSMSEWSFSDLDIDAKVGERIQFTLRNDGTILHEFMFMSMAAMQAVNYRAKRADWNLLEHEALYEKSLLLPGQEITFVAEVTKPGAWMFMCMLPYHMQMGMMGQMATEGMAMEM
ncbi:MAG: multicopper oxidase domain-containing protein [Paracoccaceae bacterium]|nr:multicopper oxidase domain-containing protein [Paracoccaceae bacterium]